MYYACIIFALRMCAMCIPNEKFDLIKFSVFRDISEKINHIKDLKNVYFF